MNNSATRRLFLRRLRYILFIVVFTIVALELLLRLYYPFPTRIRGDRFELSTNQQYSIRNRTNHRLDPVIIHRRNSIGFRGPDPPADISQRLSLLTIGGSTTECTWLSEDRTWPDCLSRCLAKAYPSLWINNAGLDGHSTFGNLNLLHYYLPTLPFRPKIALFLIGANDVNRQDLDRYDPALNNGWWQSLKRWGMRHSETVHFISDLKNSLWPPQIFPSGNGSGAPNYPALQCTAQQIDSAVRSQDSLLPAFSRRLGSIISICRQNGIKPVFMTQPLSVNGQSAAGSWKLFWYELQPYNAMTRSVAAREDIPCIDLAVEMPADTAYYYDMLHFTDRGAEKVAGLVCQSLRPWMDSAFKAFRQPDP